MAEFVARLDEALRGDDDPELHLLRGQMAYVTVEGDLAASELTAAWNGFERAGLAGRAALAAASLGQLYFECLGNRVAANAWLARASRLIAGAPRCLEQGWVAVTLVGCSISDPTALEANAAVALAIAEEFGDVALEGKALADGGLALVSLGQVKEGMTRLDEAMALVTSGAIDDAVMCGLIACSMASACERSGDLARAESWIALLTDLGMIATDQTHMVSHCSTVYGSLLRDVGRWEEAERALAIAVETGDRGLFMHRLMARSALADLRVHQGRLDEAESLLLGLDDRIEALTPLTRLHLSRSEYDLAAAVARRGLRMLGGDRTRAVSLLALLVEAELGLDQPDQAELACNQLSALADLAAMPALVAQAAFARARVAVARDDVATAVACLEAALAGIGVGELPLLRATIHLELARLQARVDPPSALAEARAAVAIHARVGAPLAEFARELLAALEVDAGLIAAGGAVPGAVPTRAALYRGGDYWTLQLGSATARLRDSKGIRYLAELIAHPQVERHALDLVDLVEGMPSEAGLDRRRLGDAGELLDATAKAAYRRRLEVLREDMDEAEALGDETRAWRIQAEIDALLAELSRAVGLGGRDRRAGGAAEKARINVTRAIRTAIARIEEVLPELGRQLDRDVRTGLFCSYQPALADPIDWVLA
ncbi:MAG: tetratricopeptide repeat protein, partial [Actinomycetota bacterium]